MPDTEEPRTQGNPHNGSSGAAETALVDSPFPHNQEAADQPSQNESQHPKTTDALQEGQQGGQDRQDGSDPKSASGEKSKPAKGQSFKDRGRYLLIDRHLPG